MMEEVREKNISNRCLFMKTVVTWVLQADSDKREPEGLHSVFVSRDKYM